ncbi:MAG: hypothetical protein AB8F78_09410 [Saprospiraceae bacterium]
MKDFFQVDRTVFEASAPGRIDVMGGVAEYSGSLLLQMSTDQRTSVQVQLTEEDFFTVVGDFAGAQRSAVVSLEDVFFWRLTQPIADGDPEPENFWTRYVLGCFLLGAEQFGFPLTGARIYIKSDVPIREGLSSSAALEVATLRVLAKAYDLNFGTLELPKLAQRVQQEIVGSSHGLMGQFGSHHGVTDALLPLYGQPAKLHSSISIPGDLMFERVSSGVSKPLSQDAFSAARTAAFMGYAILAKQMGATPEQLNLAKESGDWSSLPAEGYLANFDAKHFEQNLEETLPETMLGADFLAAGNVNIDLATVIDPRRVYSVRAAASHPVYEHACIRQFASLLAQIDQVDLPRHQVFARLGLLMLSSHASYSALGLGHEATDDLVHDVIAKGAKRGYYGARVTGGGCGGSVVVLRKR